MLASTCNHGDVRLFGGYGDFEGAPEVCINGKWTYGCYQGWNMKESTYFCKLILQSSNISKFKFMHHYGNIMPFIKLYK